MNSLFFLLALLFAITQVAAAPVHQTKSSGLKPARKLPSVAGLDESDIQFNPSTDPSQPPQAAPQEIHFNPDPADPIRPAAAEIEFVPSGEPPVTPTFNQLSNKDKQWAIKNGFNPTALAERAKKAKDDADAKEAK
jgi:hypothetical protein